MNRAPFIAVGLARRAPDVRNHLSRGLAFGGGLGGILSRRRQGVSASQRCALGTRLTFRDPSAPGTTNLSNGLQFTTCP